MTTKEMGDLLPLVAGLLTALALVLYVHHLIVTILTNITRPVRHRRPRTAPSVGGTR